MTFKDFIDRYQHINHRLGDLADDIALDDDFPESTDFYENLHYLTGKGVSQACIDTFFDAWAKYRKDPEDQTALYIAMLMEKIDILTGVIGHIADALEFMNDEDQQGPVQTIAANVSLIDDKLDSIIGEYYNGGYNEPCIRIMKRD